MTERLDIEPLARKRRVLSPTLIAGAVLVGIILALTLLGLYWTPRDPNAISISTRLAGPGEHGYLLGSDEFGRDVLSLLMVGGRNAMVIAFTSSASALLLGLTFGGFAAVRGGYTEETVMRTADILYAFPATIMAIVVAASLGTGVLSAIVAIIVIFTPTTARIVRGASLNVLGRDWYSAARAYGRKPLQIFIRQGIPNISAVLIVQGTLMFAIAILIEASLSYLGLGVQPPTPSWGRILRDAQEFITIQSTLAVFPGLVIFMTVLGVNLIGDGLRDALDPRA